MYPLLFTPTPVQHSSMVRQWIHILYLCKTQVICQTKSSRWRYWIVGATDCNHVCCLLILWFQNLLLTWAVLSLDNCDNKILEGSADATWNAHISKQLIQVNIALGPCKLHWITVSKSRTVLHWAFVLRHGGNELRTLTEVNSVLSTLTFTIRWCVCFFQWHAIGEIFKQCQLLLTHSWFVFVMVCGGGFKMLKGTERMRCDQVGNHLTSQDFNYSLF